MKIKSKSTIQYEDVKINVRIILTVLWIMHFLIWTFGDMLSLLQRLNEPAPELLLAMVAAPQALLQLFLMIFPLYGSPKKVRITNLILVWVYVIFNVGFIVEAQHGWEYVLGAGYLAVNALIIKTAWTWPGEVKNHVG